MTCNATHKRVLNTTSTTKAKKKSANSAFLLLFMLKYITSIVLRYWFVNVGTAKRIGNKIWTNSRIVLLYLNGLKTRSKRNVRNIENLKNAV